jgi:hypothetical protein
LRLPAKYGPVIPGALTEFGENMYKSPPFIRINSPGKILYRRESVGADIPSGSDVKNSVLLVNTDFTVNARPTCP